MAKAKKSTKLKCAATLTIADPENMSVRGRKDVANWLVRQARALQRQGGTYSKRFRARYLYS